MNKKILIGSIIAVTILVLVSFTSVVGYNSVESNSKPSPLFTVRSNRAIDEESKDLTCDYVGKDKDVTIPFPTFNSRNTLLQKVIDTISRMDDETFNRFKILVFEQIRKMNIAEENIIQDELQLLNYLKYAPEVLKICPIDSKEDKTNPPTMMSFDDECCFTSSTPLCRFITKLMDIIFAILDIPWKILNYIISFMQNC